MGKEDHADETRDEPFQGEDEIGAGVKPGAKNTREKRDQNDEYDADGSVN